MMQASKDALLADAARLAALPNFPEAVRRYSAGAARFQQSPWVVNKLISHDARWRVIGYLLYLHSDREVFGPEGGATYGRLVEICTRRQEASPRVLKTMLALLKLTGFIKTRRSGTDGRSKLYSPTERLNGFTKAWLTYASDVLDVLEPGMQRARLLREEASSTAESFLVSGGRDHLSGTDPMACLPEFTSFFEAQQGGFAVILAIMLADLDHQPTPSRGDIAKRFGLSKTQVTNIIVSGEREGLFLLDEARVPTPTARLREYYRRWVSIELAYYAKHMRGHPR